MRSLAVLALFLCPVLALAGVRQAPRVPQAPPLKSCPRCDDACPCPCCPGGADCLCATTGASATPTRAAPAGVGWQWEPDASWPGGGKWWRWRQPQPVLYQPAAMQPLLFQPTFAPPQGGFSAGFSGGCAGGG